MDASPRTPTKPDAVESTTPPYSPLTSSKTPSIELTTSSKDGHEKAYAPNEPDGMKLATLTTTYTPQGASSETVFQVEIDHKDLDASSASKPPTPLSSSKRGQMRAASTAASPSAGRGAGKKPLGFGAGLERIPTPITANVQSSFKDIIPKQADIRPMVGSQLLPVQIQASNPASLTFQQPVQSLPSIAGRLPPLRPGPPGPIQPPTGTSMHSLQQLQQSPFTSSPYGYQNSLPSPPGLINYRLQELYRGFHVPQCSPMSPSFLDPRLYNQTEESVMVQYHRNRAIISKMSSENEIFFSVWMTRFHTTASKGPVTQLVPPPILSQNVEPPSRGQDGMVQQGQNNPDPRQTTFQGGRERSTSSQPPMNAFANSKQTKQGKATAKNITATKPKTWFQTNIQQANLPTSKISQEAMDLAKDFEPGGYRKLESTKPAPRNRDKPMIDSSKGFVISADSSQKLIDLGAANATQGPRVGVSMNIPRASSVPGPVSNTRGHMPKHAPIDSYTYEPYAYEHPYAPTAPRGFETSSLRSTQQGGGNKRRKTSTIDAPKKRRVVSKGSCAKKDERAEDDGSDVEA